MIKKSEKSNKGKKMDMIWQQTIKMSLGYSGIGLHSGKKVRMTLKPAPPDTGIIFKRIDLGENSIIKAEAKNLINVNYATTLSQNGVKIQTVEHLLAAFMGLNIDNIIVEIDSPEVPIMDGSAVPFVFLIHEAGILVQNKPRKFIKIKKTIRVGDKEKFIKVVPDDQFRISYFISFNHPVIASQRASYVCNGANFVKNISRARTFGFLSEVKMLRKKGLAKGGSLDNAVVVDNYRILNGNLRYKDEFVCHKIIDAMGDIYLLGYPLIGHVIAHRAGHGLHAMLVDKILKNPKHWRLITYTKPDIDLPFVPNSMDMSASTSDMDIYLS